jgi:hypothetical protein
MKNDIHSLSTLRDIVIPEAPPLWPPAPGMWLIIGIGLMVALVLIFRLYRNRKRRAYRRAGILLLQDVQTVRDISVLLKRVALSVFPRERVASIYGKEWAAFLTATCPRGDFSRIGKLDPKTSAKPELVDLAGLWIRYHHLSDDRAPEKGR